MTKRKIYCLLQSYPFLGNCPDALEAYVAFAFTRVRRFPQHPPKSMRSFHLSTCTGRSNDGLSPQFRSLSDSPKDWSKRRWDNKTFASIYDYWWNPYWFVYLRRREGLDVARLICLWSIPFRYPYRLYKTWIPGEAKMPEPTFTIGGFQPRIPQAKSLRCHLVM